MRRGFLLGERRSGGGSPRRSEPVPEPEGPEGQDLLRRVLVAWFAAVYDERGIEGGRRVRVLEEFAGLGEVYVLFEAAFRGDSPAYSTSLLDSEQVALGRALDAEASGRRAFVLRAGSADIALAFLEGTAARDTPIEFVWGAFEGFCEALGAPRADGEAAGPPVA